MPKSPDQSLQRHSVEILSDVLIDYHPFHIKKGMAQSGLLAVIQIIMASIDLDLPSKVEAYGEKQTDSIIDVLNQLKLVHRKVTLAPDFWKICFGSMLAFKKDSGKPVALLYEAGHYVLHDPESGQTERVNARIFETLALEAWAFCRPLPSEPISFKKFFKFIAFKTKKDWYKLFWLSLLVSLVGLFIPYAQAVFVNHILPNDRYLPLIWMNSLLLASATVAAGSNLSKNFLELALIGKYTYTAQAAIFQRLLKLPTSFFKQYQSGDLVMRALGLTNLSQYFTTANFNALLALPFSLVLLVFITYLSPILGLLAGVLVVIFVAVTLTVAWGIFKRMRKAMALLGEVSAQLFQFLLGIDTLHTTGTEDRAFHLFAKQYAEKESAFYKAGYLNCILETFYLSFPILGFLMLYIVGSELFEAGSTSFNIGIFIAVNAAFGSLFGILQLFAQMLMALPVPIVLLERVRPILQEIPEAHSTQSDCKNLQGKIEARGLSFRYNEHSPWIFQDLHFEAEPGEFVAIVGPSGMGKSTLLRLLLGFEKPTLGSIFYDNKDFSGLNVESVRRQMGVVIQNSQLLRGDIFSNITAGLNYTEEQAWNAAKQVGLLEDIQSLPMGMFTYIGENGANLSGGQRQQLMLARALIRQPNVMILDEATSQLDNVCQELVSNTLKELAITRIVIAHRLSTIKQADRIYVLNNGRFVESGTFDELVALNGEFSQLVGQDLNLSPCID